MSDDNFGSETEGTNFKQLLMQNKKVLIIGVSALVVLFVLIFLIVWLTSGSSIPKDFKEYRNVLGWKMAYPPGWDMKLPKDNDVGFFSKKENEGDLFQEGLGVKETPVPAGTKLDTFLKEFMNKLNEKKANLIESKTIKYKTYDVQQLIYNVGGLLDDGTKTTFRVFQRLVLGKNRVFILTYAAEQDKFDKYKQQAIDSMNTLEF